MTKTVFVNKHNSYRLFSNSITAAILVFQSNETETMLVSQNKPMGVERFPRGTTFVCSNQFVWMLATSMKTLSTEFKS